ncbi:MAG: hypothetical protein IIA14_15680 [SAR324 cluster bacterium]|nr:hypothetical protein [SAR324 cluster bacterium]
MEIPEQEIWEMMVYSRMNKYYHQRMSARFSAFDTTFSLVALVAVFFGGVGLISGWMALAVQGLIWVAAVFSLAVVVLKLSEKIKQHEALFRRWNEHETKWIALEYEQLAEQDELKLRKRIMELKVEFTAIEADQPNPWNPTLEKCRTQALVEEGADPKRPVPTQASPNPA